MKRWKKGQKNEQLFSEFFHHQNGEEIFPILVCPHVLRSRGMGQIDFARLDQKKSLIEVVELKSSQLPQLQQNQRLKKSANYLAQILNCSIIFRVVLFDERPREEWKDFFAK